MSDDFEAYVDKHLTRLAERGPDTIASLRADNHRLTARVTELEEGLEDITGAGEVAWGSGRPCVKRARALLTPATEKGGE